MQSLWERHDRILGSFGGWSWLTWWRRYSVRKIVTWKSRRCFVSVMSLAAGSPWPSCDVAAGEEQRRSSGEGQLPTVLRERSHQPAHPRRWWRRLGKDWRGQRIRKSSLKLPAQHFRQLHNRTSFPITNQWLYFTFVTNTDVRADVTKVTILVIVRLEPHKSFIFWQITTVHSAIHWRNFLHL